MDQTAESSTRQCTNDKKGYKPNSVSLLKNENGHLIVDKVNNEFNVDYEQSHTENIYQTADLSESSLEETEEALKKLINNIPAELLKYG